MSQAPTQLTRTSSSAGASQLDVAAVWAFTSSKTSPGEARMFINRAVSDIVTGGGLAGCCSKGGGSSCMWFGFSRGLAPLAQIGGITLTCPAWRVWRAWEIQRPWAFVPVCGISDFNLAVRPGFEPGQRPPKGLVLPLHHRTKPTQSYLPIPVGAKKNYLGTGLTESTAGTVRLGCSTLRQASASS